MEMVCNPIKPYEESMWAPVSFLVNPNEIDIITLYHGTTDRYKDRIYQDGIAPRDVSGVADNDSAVNSIAKPSIEGLVYLGVKPIAKGFGAKRAVGAYGGRRLIIEVEVNTMDLLPDEDSHKNTWYESLQTCGCCAHRGVIPLSKIKNYEIIDKEIMLPRDIILSLMPKKIDGKISKEEFEEKCRKLQEIYSQPL